MSFRTNSQNNGSHNASHKKRKLVNSHNSESPPALDIVWMDLEMTGLDPQRDLIIEVATLITDKHLNILATGPELIIHQPLSVLENMDSWNQKHHQKSGLWDKVLASTTKLAEAEVLTVEFLRQHSKPSTLPLAGNSVWQDRRFLRRYMPEVDQHLHYRLVDVSAIKELSKRWYPHLSLPTKKGQHRAMDDIKESIEELRYFREHIFIQIS